MTNLIITVIAIALFAASLTAGTDYINFTRVQALGDKTFFETGISSLVSGIGQFRLISNRDPVNLTEINPAFRPVLPSKFRWIDFNFINVGFGRFIDVCFYSPEITKPSSQALTEISDSGRFESIKVWNPENISSDASIALSCDESQGSDVTNTYSPGDKGLVIVRLRF